MLIHRSLRPALTFAIASAMWLSAEQPAQAGLLLAQTGAAKTAIGWLLVVLCLALALLVVCRPSRRKRLEDNQ